MNKQFSLTRHTNILIMNINNTLFVLLIFNGVRLLTFVELCLHSFLGKTSSVVHKREKKETFSSFLTLKDILLYPTIILINIIFFIWSERIYVDMTVYIDSSSYVCTREIFMFDSTRYVNTRKMCFKKTLFIFIFFCSIIVDDEENVEAVYK